jgi:hypothetical protein
MILSDTCCLLYLLYLSLYFIDYCCTFNFYLFHASLLFIFNNNTGTVETWVNTKFNSKESKFTITSDCNQAKISRWLIVSNLTWLITINQISFSFIIFSLFLLQFILTLLLLNLFFFLPSVTSKINFLLGFPLHINIIKVLFY